MAKGLYSTAEIGRMTENGLDELLSYYLDTGNTEGAQRVTHELDDRYDALMARADEEAERAQDAEQDRRQQLHDEQVDSMYADGTIG